MCFFLVFYWIAAEVERKREKPDRSKRQGGQRMHSKKGSTAAAAATTRGAKEHHPHHHQQQQQQQQHQQQHKKVSCVANRMAFYGIDMDCSASSFDLAVAASDSSNIMSKTFQTVCTLSDHRPVGRLKYCSSLSLF